MASGVPRRRQLNGPDPRDQVVAHEEASGDGEHVPEASSATMNDDTLGDQEPQCGSGRPV